MSLNTRLLPGRSRLIVKTEVASSISRGLYLLATHRPENRAFAAQVIAVDADMPDECAEVKPGDRVYISPNVGHDDSVFFNWSGDDYAIVPAAALQAVETPDG